MQDVDDKTMPQQSKISNRRKLINVIFFLDSSKTHSFKFSMGSGIFVVGFILALFLFSLGSSLMSYNLWYDNENKTAKIERLLGTVFDFQVKYEKLFEHAYPVQSVEFLAESEKKQLIDSNESNTTDKVVKMAKTPSSIANSSETETVLALKNSDSQSSKIAIRELKISEDEKGLRVVFGVNNLLNPEKIDGRLWGIAVFETNDHRELKVLAPSGLTDVNKEYLLANIGLTEGFSIRYYKIKSLFFRNPSVAGRFKYIEIYSLLDNDIVLLKRQILEKPGGGEIGKNQPKNEGLKKL